MLAFQGVEIQPRQPPLNLCSLFDLLKGLVAVLEFFFSAKKNVEWKKEILKKGRSLSSWRKLIFFLEKLKIEFLLWSGNFILKAYIVRPLCVCQSPPGMVKSQWWNHLSPARWNGDKWNVGWIKWSEGSKRLRVAAAFRRNLVMEKLWLPRPVNKKGMIYVTHVILGGFS